MINHKSIRSYQSNKPMPVEDVNAIIDATRKAPTSLNGQGLTLISIENAELRKQVAKLSWDQKQIVDCCEIVEQTDACTDRVKEKLHYK